MSVAVKGRRVRLSGDSENLSESSYDDVDIKGSSETDNELNTNISSEGNRESEYETVDEEGEGSDSDENGIAIDDQAEDDQEDDEDEDVEGSVIIEYEREEGDGQESVPQKEKKLDDDEDRRNPQYIPKRGTFYEHDDRTAEDVAESAEKDMERNDAQGTERKKVWKENENKWSHDRYNEDEQAPKSRDELVAIYGYDIRNEDAPPRARRRRRYGRGPNKYTRNWEDEDAYTKTATALGLRGARRGGRGPRRGGGGIGRGQSFPKSNSENFPPLITSPIQGDNQKLSFTGNAPSKEPFPSLVPVKAGKDADKKEEKSSSQANNKNAWHMDRSKESNDSSGQETKSGNNIVHSNHSKNHVQFEEKFEKSEEACKYKKDRGHHNRFPDSEEVIEEGSRHVRSRFAGKPGSYMDTQVFTSSGGPRGRGRGIRGPAKASAEQNHTQRRSLSETRISSHDEGSGSDSGQGYKINSQVINRTQDDVSKDMEHLTINEHSQGNFVRRTERSQKNSQSHHQNQDRRQAVVPPRLQESASRPKRYSSQRQRSLPETANPSPYQQQQQQQQSPSQPPQQQQQIQQQTPNYYAPSFVQQPVYGDAAQQQVYVDDSQPQQAGTSPHALLPPPHPQAPPFAAPFPSPPAFIAPVPPPTRMLPPGANPYIAAAAPPAAPLINYVQRQFPPPPYAAYQGFPPVPPAQPGELFQPQGGITYYSPEEQLMARPIPTQKRQRAAIPIVPPPDHGISRGRGQLRKEEITECQIGLVNENGDCISGSNTGEGIYDDDEEEEDDDDNDAEQLQQELDVQEADNEHLTIEHNSQISEEVS